MALETSNQSNVIASKPTIDVRALVEKVAAERKAAEAAPPAVAPVATEPPAVKPPLDAETTVEIERRKAEIEVLREKIARLEADGARYSAAEAARKADWQLALRDAGYKAEDVLPGWIQGTEVKPAVAEADPQNALIERLSALEGVITNAKHESDRERRMRDVRAAMGDGADYAVMDTIGADQGFLDLVLAEEKRRGIPVGQNELVQMLKAHEDKARGVVKPQLEKLARSKWGKELLRAMLAEEAVTETAATERTVEPEPETRHQFGNDKPTIRLGRDLSATIEAAKRKALAHMGAKT